jgi:hypothetical protein
MPPFRTLRRSARLKSRQRGEEFAYRPLGDHEIRLVVLLPGSFSLQIECNLLHHKFDETLQYDALSYTWGDPTITDVILLDGHEFRITRGLECALRYIRLPQDRRVLWIDAICINQRDHSERSHQVQMMFDIYQNSEAVRSWIGCETEADDYCVRNKLDRLKSSYHAQSGLSIDQKSSNGSSEDWNVSKLLEVFGKPSSLEQKETLSTNSHTHICPPIVETFRSRSGLNAWCDMGVLVSRPYWTRVWIQQEISRESKVIVHFGKSSFPLTSIYNHCQSLRHFNHACSHHRADIKAAYESMRYIQRLYSYVFFLSQDFTRGPTGETKDSISALLRSQFLRRTTDPRDKIYALVGLIPHWRDGSLPVDYRLPVRYIYAAAVKVMAERYNTLDTLVTLFAIPKRISLAELPSWCPDWSKVIHFNGGITMANDIFVEDLPMFMSNDMGDASRDGPPNISFASDNQILITSGLRLDTVKYVANCFGNRFPFIEGKSWEMVQHAAGLARLFSGGPYWSYWRSHGDLMPPDNEKHMIAVKMEEAKGRWI